ncbi:MAG: IspD/TarI family cytidylyltransferase [Phycisphaerae bacterium]
MSNTSLLFSVLLPAAGSGSRFQKESANQGNGGGDKLLADIAGRSVLQRAVSLFADRPDVSLIAIITSPHRFDAYEEHLLQSNTLQRDRLTFVEGGRERWESVLFGLRHIAARAHPASFVAIHDAARPLTPPAVIDEAFRTTIQKGAALPAVPEPATLKRRAPDGTISETVPRQNLFQAQTPQCFALGKLLAAYEQLLFANQLADVTDDAQVYERSNLPVPLTSGSPLNLKITTPADLLLARAIIQSQTG